MVKIDPVQKAIAECEDEQTEAAESTVQQALDNLEQIKGGEEPETPDISSDSSDTSSRVGTPRINGGRHSHHERRVRDYLKEWYANETPDDFEIDLSELEITVTARLKKAHGRFKVKKDRMTGEVTAQEFRISENTIVEHGWEEAKRTIRHEAVHAWQHQNGYGLSHGHSFRQWLEPFDIDVYAENPAEKNPKYEIVCPNCGTVDTKTRACKTTRKVHLYHCQRCGSDDLSVKQNY